MESKNVFVLVHSNPDYVNVDVYSKEEDAISCRNFYICNVNQLNKNNMKAEIKKKLQFLIELGLNKNEINEILDKQEILNKSQEYKKEEVEEEEF